MNVSASPVFRFKTLLLASVLLAPALPALAAPDYAAEFKTVHQINAGDLNIGYVDIGPRVQGAGRNAMAPPVPGEEDEPHALQLARHQVIGRRAPRRGDGDRAPVLKTVQFVES